LLPLGLLLLMLLGLFLPFGLLLLVLWLLLPLGLLLFLRLCLLLLLRGLSLFFLFLLPRLNREGNSEQQKKCSRANDFNRLHALSP
jgi:hypothetical protein